jgi:predicted AAA+ superfamily ATPase
LVNKYRKNNLMFPRNISKQIAIAAQDTPVILLHGARQSGKSYLAHQAAQDVFHTDYVTLDDLTALGSATRDPAGFLNGLGDRAVIDEAQRVPNLLIAIKASVDRDRRPGRFLLTGSANVRSLPQFSDALAGRVEILDLWPLSQGELNSVQDNFLDAVFADDFADRARKVAGAVDWQPLALAGGFPEVVLRRDGARRTAWFDAYLQTILTRDVRDLVNIAGLAEMPHLLSLVAERASGLLNHADLARDAGVSLPTLRRYFALLHATYLIRTVQPWFTNRAKRLVKTEKLYLGDTGLLAYLADMRPDRFQKHPRMRGALLENFVFLELMKQRGWSDTRPQVLHFRTHDGQEVDFVLEAPGGRRIVGVEVKAAASVSPADTHGMVALSELAGDDFVRGVILYGGDTVVPIRENIHAVPLSCLWKLTADT